MGCTARTRMAKSIRTFVNEELLKGMHCGHAHPSVSESKRLSDTIRSMPGSHIFEWLCAVSVEGMPHGVHTLRKDDLGRKRLKCSE